MHDSIDSTFWLFLALAWGFALVTILLSWWRVDHGLAEVLVARRDHDKYAKPVDVLTQAPTALRHEWPTIYIGLRKVALENIADGKSLMQLYQQVVQRHSRYHDIEMVFPEMNLPPELESPVPPPLPPSDVTDEKEIPQ